MRFKEISVNDADERNAEEQEVGMPGQPFLNPGTHYLYWSTVEPGPDRAVYNIPPERLDEVLKRIEANRTASYPELVGDVDGAAYADEHHPVQCV